MVILGTLPWMTSHSEMDTVSVDLLCQQCMLHKDKQM